MIKQFAVSMLTHATRLWMQHWPFEVSKPSMYSFFERYVGWRLFSGTTRAFFGAQFEFQFPDLIQKRIHIFGFWEPDITAYVRDTLRSGDIFVDVGSNIGYYALFASSIVGSTGRVYAFEASPSIFSLLQKNLARNDATNVVARNLAISDAEERLWIYHAGPENIGKSTIDTKTAAIDNMSVESEVDAKPLLVAMPQANLFQARLIKIDVEGSEHSVLAPLLAELSSFSEKTQWLVEFSSEGDPLIEEKTRQVVERFKEGGYRAYQIRNEYNSAAKSYLNGLPKRGEAHIRPLDYPLPPVVDVLFTRHMIKL